MFRRLKLRPAKKQDAQKVSQLLNEFGASLSSAELSDLIDKKQVVVLQKKKKTLGAFSFVKIGLGIFTMLYIRKLVIDEKFRGQGLGSRVLKKMRGFARRKKTRGFFLWSIYSAKSFYRKNKLKHWWRIFWRRID